MTEAVVTVLGAKTLPFIMPVTHRSEPLIPIKAETWVVLYSQVQTAFKNEDANYFSIFALLRVFA